MGSGKRTGSTVGVSATMNAQLDQLSKATRRDKSDLVDEAWEYYWPVWGDHYLKQAKATGDRRRTKRLLAESK